MVIAPCDVSRNPEKFYNLLVNQSLTVLNQTPSAFYHLIPIVRNQSTPLSLHYVVFGGEALDYTKLSAWYDGSSTDSPQLVNMYSITETTVHVTNHSQFSYPRNQLTSISELPCPVHSWTSGQAFYKIWDRLTLTVQRTEHFVQTGERFQWLFVFMLVWLLSYHINQKKISRGKFLGIHHFFSLII